MSQFSVCIHPTHASVAIETLGFALQSTHSTTTGLHEITRLGGADISRKPYWIPTPDVAKMRCTQIDSDRVVEAWVTANGQRCQEYATHGQAERRGVVFDCFVPVSSGERLALGFSFQGHVVALHADLLVDGIYRNDFRCGYSKRVTTLHDQVSLKHHKPKKLFVDAIDNRGNNTDAFAMMVQDSDRFADNETIEGGVPSTGCISLVISLREYPGDNRCYPHNYASSGDTITWSKSIATAIAPTHQVALVPDASVKAIRRYRKQHFRLYGCSTWNTKGSVRFGDKPWVCFRFFYRDPNSIKENGLDLLVTPKSLAAPPPIPEASRAAEHSFTAHGAECFHDDINGSMDDNDETRSTYSSATRGSPTRHQGHSVFNNSPSKAGASAWQDHCERGNPSWSDAHYEGHQTDGEEQQYEDANQHSNDDASEVAYSLTNDASDGFRSQRYVNAGELLKLSHDIREKVTHSINSVKREHHPDKEMASLKRRKPEDKTPETILDVLERKERDLSVICKQGSISLEAKQADARWQMASLEKVQRLLHHITELENEQHEQERKERELDEAMNHADETVAYLIGPAFQDGDDTEH